MHKSTVVALVLALLAALGGGVAIDLLFFQSALVISDGTKKYKLSKAGSLDFAQGITIKSLVLRKGYQATLSVDDKNYGTLTGSISAKVDSSGYIPGGIPQIGIKKIVLATV